MKIFLSKWLFKYFGHFEPRAMSQRVEYSAKNFFDVWNALIKKEVKIGNVFALPKIRVIHCIQDKIIVMFP